MDPNDTPKMLTYIVNQVSADDVQHYAHIPNLLNQMEKLGWRIDLISEKGGVGSADILGRRVTYLSNSERWRRIPRLVSCLVRMRARGGRLVFVRIAKWTGFISALLGRLLGWKTVYWLSDVKEDFNARRRWGRIGFAGMRVLMSVVDRLATGPEKMVDYYRGTYRLSAKKVLLLYNDLNLSEIERAKGSGSASTVNVLLVHRLSPARETARYFPVLIKALHRVAVSSGKSIALDVCGDGPERTELEHIAANSAHGIQVRFHGPVPQRRLASFYDRATIFVMPSYREGFPRVVIEAMARGLPLVTTDAGGTADLCGPEQKSYVIARDDVEGFGRAVERLLASTDDQRRVGEENFSTVRRYDTREVARMYDRALSGLIGAAPAP
jgi:glycosyltransferase involved in cell wall biosynthesis